MGTLREINCPPVATNRSLFGIRKIGDGLNSALRGSLQGAAAPANDARFMAVALKSLADIAQLAIAACSAVFAGRFRLRGRDVPARLPQGPYRLQQILAPGNHSFAP